MTNYFPFWTLNFDVSHKSAYRCPHFIFLAIIGVALMLFVANINVTQYCKSNGHWEFTVFPR